MDQNSVNMRCKSCKISMSLSICSYSRAVLTIISSYFRPYAAYLKNFNKKYHLTERNKIVFKNQ